MDLYDYFPIFLIIVIGIVIILFVIMLYGNNGSHTVRLSQLRRSEMISIGMAENEMLSIMGSGYTRSLLKNNRIKYEWRMNAESYGSSFNGINERIYTGVKKVTIYVKDGFVEEVLGYNLY